MIFETVWIFPVILSRFKLNYETAGNSQHHLSHFVLTFETVFISEDELSRIDGKNGAVSLQIIFL